MRCIREILFNFLKAKDSWKSKSTDWTVIQKCGNKYLHLSPSFFAKHLDKHTCLTALRYHFLYSNKQARMKHVTAQRLNSWVRKTNWSTASQVYPVLLSQLWPWGGDGITPHQHSFKASSLWVALRSKTIWAYYTFTNLPRALAWDSISLCASLYPSQ